MSKYLPYAFTEHGAAMAAMVLTSKRAVEVSVFVVRAFMHMRRMLADNRQLAVKLAQLESKYDSQFKVVFDAIRKLMEKPKPEPEPPRKIGFHVSDTVVEMRRRKEEETMSNVLFSLFTTRNSPFMMTRRSSRCDERCRR